MTRKMMRLMIAAALLVGVAHAAGRGLQPGGNTPATAAGVPPAAAAAHKKPRASTTGHNPMVQSCPEGARVVQGRCVCPAGYGVYASIKFCSKCLNGATSCDSPEALKSGWIGSPSSASKAAAAAPAAAERVASVRTATQGTPAPVTAAKAPNAAGAGNGAPAITAAATAAPAVAAPEDAAPAAKRGDGAVAAAAAAAAAPAGSGKLVYVYDDLANPKKLVQRDAVITVDLANPPRRLGEGGAPAAVASAAASTAAKRAGQVFVYDDLANPKKLVQRDAVITVDLANPPRRLFEGGAPAAPTTSSAAASKGGDKVYVYDDLANPKKLVTRDQIITVDLANPPSHPTDGAGRAAAASGPAAPSAAKRGDRVFVYDDLANPKKLVTRNAVVTVDLANPPRRLNEGGAPAAAAAAAAAAKRDGKVYVYDDLANPKKLVARDQIVTVDLANPPSHPTDGAAPAAAASAAAAPTAAKRAGQVFVYDDLANPKKLVQRDAVITVDLANPPRRLGEGGAPAATSSTASKGAELVHVYDDLANPKKLVRRDQIIVNDLANP